MLISNWRSIFGRKPQIQFKLGSSGSSFPLDNPKEGKTLISFIFRRTSRRISGEPPPPGFILFTSKKRASKRAESAVTAEGHSLGKVKSPRPSGGGPSSKQETPGRTPGAGSSGKAMKSMGIEASEVMAVRLESSGPMGPAEGRPSKVADTGETPGVKLGSSGSSLLLDNPKKGKTLISSIFRRISRGMSGEPPTPGFTLVTSRKRSSKAAMGPSRPRNSVRNPGNGLVGRVAGSSGPLAGSVGPAGPEGPAEGRPGPSADSGRNSEETRRAVGRNGSHNCKPGHHYGLSNEVKTLDGTQDKRGIKFLTLKSLLDLTRHLLYSKECF